MRSFSAGTSGDDISEYRPFVVGRWLDVGQPKIVSTHVTVTFASESADFVRGVFHLADGSQSVPDLADALNVPVEAVVSLCSELEARHLCVDASVVAMAGHRIASYPDMFLPLRPHVDPVALSVPQSDPNGRRVVLDAELPTGVQERRTCRRFSDAPIAYEQLSAIALASYGLVGLHEAGYPLRVVPSGGAMHPLVHHFFVANVDGLDVGHWQLSMHENALIEVDDGALDETMFTDDHWTTAAVVHVIGFDLARSATRYGNRAHRYALVEAGHAAQNGLMEARRQGIGSWEYGGYRDEPLEKACGLNMLTSGIATTVFYGVPAD